ncbi:MAG TPA: hypothetical protein VLM85_14090 [Polyangiaceae bacterium]|nr:hypothetical protein [Polyangiaceae bacterium]
MPHRRAFVFALLVTSHLACGSDVDLGGPVDHCGTLVAPAVSAGCKACNPSSGGCQPNGCYGGYWCDTAKTDCHTPPTTCP